LVGLSNKISKVSIQSVSQFHSSYHVDKKQEYKSIKKANVLPPTKEETVSPVIDNKPSKYSFTAMRAYAKDMWKKYGILYMISYGTLYLSTLGGVYVGFDTGVLDTSFIGMSHSEAIQKVQSIKKRFCHITLKPFLSSFVVCSSL
jgi:hypothetical protein